MDKFKSILKSKLWRSSLGNSSSKLSKLSPILAMSGYIMPLLLGFSVGWIGAIFFDYIISPRKSALEFSMVANMAAAQSKVDTTDGLDIFTNANPFSISELPVVRDNAPVEIKQVVKVEKKDSFATAALTFTLPGIGVWMQDKTNNELAYISVGDSFDEYKLSEVLYDRATFQDEENNDITKYLYLLDLNLIGHVPPIPVPMPVVQQAVIQDSQIIRSENGEEGVIARELIDKLIMDPFDEMKRVRIRPKSVGNDPIGLEAQWIQNDSLLTKLGVQKGDVLQSINGIPIKNMGDITNAISSLMNSNRFDVEMLRGDSSVNLLYAVR